MKKISVLMLSCAVLSLTLLLAACGGGGGGSPQPPTTTPTPPPPPPPPPDDDDDVPPSPPSRSDYDLSMVASEEPPASYNRQAYYGITNIGANKLHWSRLTSPTTENLNPDNPGLDNPARYIRGGGVTVGIVDSGVDLDHPDLADNITVGAGITVGGTVYSDPSDFALGGNTDSHGTEVAGIIGARLNTFGLVGVAPEAKLLPINLTERGDMMNPVPHVSLAEAYDYITANNAFVVNNSWGIADQLLRLQDADMEVDRKVCVSDTSSAKTCWLRVPFAYDVERFTRLVLRLNQPITFIIRGRLTDREGTTIEDISSSHYTVLSNALQNRKDDLLLVFSNGNHGFNSETGEVIVCLPGATKGKDCTTRQLLSDITATELTVSETSQVGSTVITTLDVATTIPLPDPNSIGALKQMVKDFESEFGDNWINVAAVDVSNKIAFFSNGCGVAQANCLAAPGFRIRTNLIAEPIPNSDDFILFEKFNFGTSFAAPHVSGAAALLKGAFPNLSAPEVREILLQSADHVGDCAAIDKKMDDPDNPCTDKVYGHGILNVIDAFTPTSHIALTSPARLNAGGVDEGAFSLADSRIELSPAFGAAAWQKESLAIGGLDNYGRVYYTQMDLSDGVFVVKPLWEDGEITGGGIHESYASPLLRAQQSAAFAARDSLAGGQWQGRHDNMDYSLSYGARAQQRAIGWQQGGGRLSWNYLSGSDDVAASDFNTDDNSWRLPFSAAAMHQFAGAFDFSDSATGLPQVGISYGRSEDDSISQLASYAKWGSDDSGSLRLEGGYIQEKDGVLGASFAGGFALSPGETFYQRLSGHHQWLGVDWYADYVHARSKAAGDGGIVQSLKARSDAWTVGANRGRWSLQWSQPLAINAGSMALSYISGYTESGDYAVTDKRLDISSGNRLQRTTLLYMREATDDLTFAFSLDYLRNAPHRDYRKDAFIGAAALRYTF